MKDRFLTLDAGAGKVLLCEFSRRGGGAPVLVNYALAEREGVAQEQVGALFSDLTGSLRALMQERGIAPAPLYLMLPGQSVFSRFVRIDGSAADMVEELVANEAAEGLPFPLDQVVWDYQLLGEDAVSGEQDVLIVATKRETAREAAVLAATNSLPLELIAAAPLPLANAVKASLPEGDEACTLVLDIGARSTDLVFLEGEKVFLRTIPVAGNTITLELAKQLDVPAEQAEEIKKTSGFVALGGNFAVVDDDVADRASKIIRNVLIRLHMEVSRSIAFYRSQQGGSAPVRVLLTGGTSLLRHIDTFFNEKLGAEVSFFDPLAVMGVAKNVALSDEDAFLMAGSAGLALRATRACAIEGNLIPESVLEERRFRARLPYFAVAAIGILLSIGCWYLHEKKLADGYERSVKVLQAEKNRLEGLRKAFANEAGLSTEILAREAYLEKIAASRHSMPAVLESVRAALLPGMWIRSLSFRNEGAEKGGLLFLSVAGFKQELDELKDPASETLLANLKKAPFFSEKDSEIERVQTSANGHVTEMRLKLALTRPLGKPHASFLPGGAAAVAREEEADE